MSLTILSVSYPLATVTPGTPGGAEQVLARLDRAIVAAGHRSIVVAPAGSVTSGTLVATEPAAPPFDDAARALAQARHRLAIAETIHRERVDVVHLHGLDFDAYLPPPGMPALVTLHLPLAWYPLAALRPSRADTWLHCVSASQHRERAPDLDLLEPIENGVDIEAFRPDLRRRGFAVILGRICPEKGIHLAIDAAGRAGVPLLIAGATFPYDAHLRYLDEAIRPRLGPRCRQIGPVGPRARRRLLSSAACVLAPSLAPETSSLVAREAAACGAPVIAFRSGALVDAVEEGRTGFLVDDVAGLAAAIGRIDEIDPAACRETARRRFSDRDMVAAYLALYAQLAAGRSRPSA